MNCAEYKQQFSLYLDGQVSGREAELAEALRGAR